MKKPILVLGFVCLALILNAQITGVQHLIEYNMETEMYDCKIVITGGQAETYPQRIQFNSQYSIVKPAGATFSIDTLYEPREENQFYTGTIPCLWEISSAEYAPPITPDVDYVAISPNLSPPSAFDNLYAGDTITLFSISSDADPCTNPLRPFENETDPASANMPSGGDFSNGYSFGVGGQVYKGNAIPDKSNYISNNDTLSTCYDDCLELIPSVNCAPQGTTYEWSTGESTETIEVCPTTATDYYLLLRDEDGELWDSIWVHVNLDDVVILSQETSVCAGESLQLKACPGEGSWFQVSGNPFGAQIVSQSEGIADVEFDDFMSGEYGFTFSALGIVKEVNITVHSKPLVNVSDTYLCIGETANANANIPGGTWVSDDPSVVVVYNNTGVIEAISPGAATLTYTSPEGCTNTTTSITVVSEIVPEFVGPDSICTFGTTSILPSSGGIWTSSNDLVATIDNGGNITGLTPGFAVFSFQDIGSACNSLPSDTLYVLEDPEVEILGEDRICIGETTLVGSNQLGTWVSNNPSVATVDVNTGVVTGVGQGTVTVTLTDHIAGCTATTTGIIVDPNPAVAVEDNTICIGAMTTLQPSFGGSWVAVHPAIASLSGGNMVQGESSGIADFVFTSDATGCSSTLSIIVDEGPITTLTGPDTICIGETTTIEPNVGGSWSSDNNTVATVDNFGNITGVGAGVVRFIFTEASTLCYSEPSEPVYVHPMNTIELEETEICIGQTTQASTSGVGTWTSSDPSVITIDANTGLITAVASGSAVVNFTNTSTGCTSYDSDQITVYGIIAPQNVQTNGPLCEGEDLNLYTDYVQGALYQWVGPNGYSSEDQNPSISGVSPTNSGTYCVSIIIDGCESEQTCTEVVIINPTPATPNAEYNGPVCEGEVLNLSTDHVVGATYSWTGPNGFTATNQNPTIFQASGFEIGTFCVTISIDGCESQEGCVDVIVNATPSIPEISNNGPLCEGDDLELSTETIPGATYHWVGPNGYASNLQNPVISQVTHFENGSYCVTIAVDGCESPPVCTDVTVYPTPATPTASNNGPICSGEDFQLLTPIVAGATYAWTGPNGFTSTDQYPVLSDATPSNSGSYCVVVEVDGCRSHEGCTDVLVNLRPFITIGNNSLCKGQSTTVSPSTGGSYLLSDESIGYVEEGIFYAESSGTVQLVFIADSGCASYPTTIDVANCFEPAISCEDIDPDDILCDYNKWSAIEGSLNFGNTNGSQPQGELCEDGDGVDNISWFGFVALEGDYEIVFNFENCIPFIGMGNGVQIGIYSDCDFTESSKIFCRSIESDAGQVRISSDILETEQTYYLYIDGFQNAVCDYSFDVEGFYDNTFCTDLSKVTGVAYVDANENGMYEVGETLLRNALISLSPGNFSVLTNDEGNYIINTPKGGATLTAKMNEGYWIDDLITIEDLSIFETCVEGVNFGFVPNLFYQEAKVSVANTITRCDWETKFYFTVENTGTMDVDAKIEFEFDDRSSYFSTSQIGLQVNGNVASANLGIIEPFETYEFWITLKMPAGSASLPILEFNTTLFNSADMEMDSYAQEEQLRCSYDPNDKRTFPDREGEENLTLMDEELEYTIRFQNNGNDTAFLVKIIDPIDPNIDRTSIRVISASHDVETCIEGDNLIFIFEDIYLVDSMTNYDGSQGYVSYRCNTLDGRAENTIVRNTADIIFDTNVPIVTNTTKNTLVSQLCYNVTTETDIYICDGESYHGFEESGTYTEMFTLPFGCDSLSIIHLEVQGVTYASQSIEVCEGEVFEINEVEYELYESQLIRDSLFTDQGCLSHVYMYNVDVSPTILIEMDTTICEGFDYNGWTESGTYTIESIDDVTGCDVLTTVELEVLTAGNPLCLTSIQEEMSSSIRLYPNPAQDQFQIVSEGNIAAITILDLDH